MFLFLAVITVINLIFNIQYTNFLRPLRPEAKNTFRSRKTLVHVHVHPCCGVEFDHGSSYSVQYFFDQKCDIVRNKLELDNGQPTRSLCPPIDNHTAKTKYRNFETNITKKRNIGASVPVSTFMCLWAIYICFPTIGMPFLLEEICRLILELCKSLIDTWMLKLGLRPRYSQERNRYVGFSLQCIDRQCQSINYLQICRIVADSARLWCRGTSRGSTSTALRINCFNSLNVCEQNYLQRTQRVPLEH